DLVRVLGERFTARVSMPPLLATHPEEWTSPFISLDRERLYYGTTSGLLEGRSLSSWDVLWSKKGMGSIGSSMGEYEGRLPVGAGSSLLAIDGQTGEEKARLDLAGSIGGRMVITGTVAIIPVRPNGFVAIDLAKHELLWRMKQPTPEGITVRGQA